MAKASDLTVFAQQGYVADETHIQCPHLASSACWFAFKLGEYLKRTGRSAPRDVRMGRGYQVHANDMLFSFDNKNEITRIK